MPIPHLNTSEAAFVSLGDVIWDDQRSYSADAMDVVTWNYYTLPPSPPASVSSNAEDSPQLGTKVRVRPCFTSEPPSSSSPPPSIPRQLAFPSDNGPPLKQSFSTIGGVKKGRGSGERITTKDFVPPDVTSLSKREARLLKNRAAAFLSRQRKKAEFEAMEIRVRELEEENSRLQALEEKGKNYDDLLSNLEQLRLRLLTAEKRERELTVELAKRTAANLAVKTESHDLNLPPTSYSSYPTIGQAPIITAVRESLLLSLPSLLSLRPQTSLPITFSIPLMGSSSVTPLSASFNHPASPCDIKDQGRGGFGNGCVGFHPSSADVESSRNMGIGVGGELSGARQFDMDGDHCLGSFSIAFDAMSTEGGRGCVRVHVSERITKAAIHRGRQRASSLASWPGGDGTFATTCYASPPLSAPISIPLPSGIDHLGVLAGTSGSTHSRMGFDAHLMSSGYTPFVQHDPEQTFNYYQDWPSNRSSPA